MTTPTSDSPPASVSDSRLVELILDEEFIADCLPVDDWRDALDTNKLLRELQQRRAADKWQPIATAPKDGRQILVTSGIFDHDDNMYGAMPFTGIAMVNWRDDRWEGGKSGGHDEYYFYSPTHWMPLPEPPK